MAVELRLKPAVALEALNRMGCWYLASGVWGSRAVVVELLVHINKLGPQRPLCWVKGA